MPKKRIYIGLLVIVVIFLATVLVVRIISPEDNWICNKIGSCFKHGNPSAPSPVEGGDFRNLSIKEGEQIASPLRITGEVKGGWFFEGSFPITLVDWDGRIIAEGLAKATSEWMTADYVSFTSEIKFIKPANPTNQDYAKRGAIIFKKDNPSGLSKNDKSYELPIKF